MTKSELIEKIAEKNPHLLLKDVERIVNVVFEKITMSPVSYTHLTLPTIRLV